MLGAAWSRAAGDVQRLAREAVEVGHRRLVAVGGDGTVFEVLHGALSALPPEERLSLAVLPLGTGNSLVRHFAGPGTRATAWAEAALLRGDSRPLDLLKVTSTEGVHFAASAVSFGLVTDVASLVNRRLKPLGKLGYTLGALRELVLLRQRTFALASRESVPLPGRAPLLTVQNTEYIGGDMRIAPDADPCDGLADVVWIAETGRLTLLRAFPRIFRGTHTSHPAFRRGRVRHLEVRAPARGEVMLDGEVLELAVRGIEVWPGAIDFLA